MFLMMMATAAVRWKLIRREAEAQDRVSFIPKQRESLIIVCTRRRVREKKGEA